MTTIDAHHVRIGVALEVDVEARAAAVKGIRAFVKDEHDRLLPPARRRTTNLRGDGGLAGARASHNERAGAFFDAAAEQRIQFGDV